MVEYWLSCVQSSRELEDNLSDQVVVEVIEEIQICKIIQTGKLVTVCNIINQIKQHGLST